jgi:uncharacterized repeat protein (TIGR01451 family)
VTANLRTPIEEERELSMNRDLMLATALTTLKKIALTLLCSTVLMVFAAPAQTIQQIKTDPGNNNPPPAGPLLDLSGTPIPGGGNSSYQQYSVKFTASLANTAITFAFRDDPAFISFANAQVADLTTPSGNLLVDGDFSGGISGWTYVNTFGATFGGVPQSGAVTCYTFPFCWYDGAVQAYDAISQTIPTTVGHLYQITFFVAENSSCSTNGGGACNFSDLSTNGIPDTGGNGINVTVYAQGGVPEVTVTQQGAPMDQNGGGLTQAFTLDSGNGQRVEFDFDFSPGFNLNSENLTVKPGTTPFVGFTGIPQSQYQALVAGTAMADTFCPTALGLKDSNGATQCVLNTLTATTTASNVASGANLPTDNSPANTRDILFTQVFDLDPASLPGGGQLVIPAHTAPGIAEFNDFGACPYPSDDPLSGKPCPRSIMTSILDGPTKPGGTPHPAGSSQVFFCCEPEWTTVPTIPLWTNAVSILVPFTSTPPATPVGDTNGFHAAQGLGVSFGAVARGVQLDPTFSYPSEQTALNSTQPSGCPNSPNWTQQNPIPFNATGTLFQFDNGGASANLVEGPYDLLFAPLDCDEFLGLVYPPVIHITGTEISGNLAQWNRTPFNVDTTNPTVGPITFSATGTTFLINQAVTASVTCMDPSSASVSNFFSGIAKCGSQSSPQAFSGNQQTQIANNVPVPTNIAGANQFTAFAQDVAGNQVMQQVPYTVVYPSADMDLIQIGPLFVKSGSNATYNMAVWNEGPGPAYNVVVSDVVPNSETVLSANYALVTCTLFGCPPPPSGSPSCTFSPNTPGNGATCTIVGGVPVIPKGARSFLALSVKLVAKVSASAGSIVKTTATVNASNPNPDKNTSFPWFTFVIR